MTNEQPAAPATVRHQLTQNLFHVTLSRHRSDPDTVLLTTADRSWATSGQNLQTFCRDARRLQSRTHSLPRQVSRWVESLLAEHLKREGDFEEQGAVA